MLHGHGHALVLQQLLVHGLRRQALLAVTDLEDLIVSHTAHLAPCTLQALQPQPLSLNLTLATSAVCWKYDSDDACRVIRSVGDPDGALRVSCARSRLLNSPVDQQERVRDASVRVFLPSACGPFCSTHQLVGQQDVSGRVLGEFCPSVRTAVRSRSPSAISSMSWPSNSSSTFMTRSFLTMRTGVSSPQSRLAHRRWPHSPCCS